MDHRPWNSHASIIYMAPSLTRQYSTGIVNIQNDGLESLCHMAEQEHAL